MRADTNIQLTESIWIITRRKKQYGLRINIIKPDSALYCPNTLYRNQEYPYPTVRPSPDYNVFGRYQQLSLKQHGWKSGLVAWLSGPIRDNVLSLRVSTLARKVSARIYGQAVETKYAIFVCWSHLPLPSPGRGYWWSRVFTSVQYFNYKLH